MKVKISVLCIMLFMLASQAHAVQDEYDVVVSGAGTGGVAAAIQASRMGVSVLLVEGGRLLGGQAVSSGVSNMDDMSDTESGIYSEFINRVEEYYSLRGKSINTSYWEMRYKAFEPHVGNKILSEMTKGEDAPDILYESEIIGVDRENVIAVDSDGVRETGIIHSVIIRTPQGLKNIACKILIDATEYGDVLALSGAKYRSGNSISPNINPDSMIQDITWTAIIRKYPDGIPERLKPKSPLPGYDHAKWNYERYITKNGFDFKGVYPVELPVNFVSHNAYRGMPDSFLPGNYDSAPENWPLFTKSGVNWGNDYPGYYMWKGKYGLPAAYLEDKSLRSRIERDALIKTLHFIYYIQNELGESWSVDENEYNYLPEAAKDLPEEWKNIARHLPPVPYVRESRRVIGKYTLTSSELYRNSQSYHDGNKNNEFSDSIATGRYILDLHHSDTNEYMEHDLNEKAEYMKSNSPKNDFQVPMRILIPEGVDGLIAAEKNLSMSRLVSGALRLQPITMMTGQAAGALAAISIIQNKHPREIKAIRVQRALVDSGVVLSLAKYSDVSQDNKYFGSVQLANLYQLLEPVKYPENDEAGIFGVDDPITEQETSNILKRFNELTGRNIELNAKTRGEAVDVLVRAMEKL